MILQIGFKTTDVKRFESTNKLSINIYELKFNLEGENWKHKLVPVEISSSKNDTEIDLMIYENHYVLIKKLHTFIGNPKRNFISRRCLSCIEHDFVLKKHKERREQQDFTAIRFFSDKHLTWKKHYRKVPLYFRKNADFECNNEKDNSIMGEKTTNIYKQNPVCNGYYIVSDMTEVLAKEYEMNFYFQ